MQRHVFLIANDPAIVAWWRVEHIAGAHFDHGAVVHGCDIAR
jgi:hypothetical protein